MADPLAVPRTSGTEGPDLLPLAPFLASLRSDGIRPTLHDYERIHLVLRSGGPWTIGRMRSVLSALLVRDREQELTFRRRFDRFFAREVQEKADLSEIDLERILAKLRVLDRTPELTKERVTVPRRPWWGLVWPNLSRFFSRRIHKQRQRDEYETLAEDRRDHPASESEEETVEEYPIEEALLFDVEGPRLFRAGKVGGDPAPRLDGETLDRLADSLGYFRSQETSQDLDVFRSCEATGRSGGIPRLVFELRKRVRSVVVLEDSCAEARLWNPIAGELALGLQRCGVPVIHGRFRGVPERFRTADGREHALEDLEDDRRGYLLLIFSDGKGLHHHSDGFVFEALSRWPMVAWMELRERRAWDESTAVPARFGLPVYPSTREGLLRGLARFGSERSSGEDFSGDTDRWRGMPSGGSGSRLEEHDLERFLGDSLAWAQSCAMMVPPVSLGLADALRRRFHNDLPPERIERLATLPGATYSAAGLRFSSPLLELLRRGFQLRSPEAWQREVLGLLGNELRKVEPAAVGSLEHQAWEWRLERLRLGLDPAPARKRLAELAKGPLGEAIRAELPDEIAAAPTPGQEKVHEKDGSVLVYVPAGTYTLGADDITEDEKPIHQVELSAFWIGKYPATNQQFARFLEANPREEKPKYWGIENFDEPQQPVVGVSWSEADAYCRWAGLALPSEAQWEAAARGTDQRPYPWGGENPTAKHASFGRQTGKTAPVGGYPEGQGPFGTFDQAGNVWEWCVDVWGRHAYRNRYRQVDPVSTAGDASVRVLRGGSWANSAAHLAAAYRTGAAASVRSGRVGFRCMLLVGPKA